MCSQGCACRMAAKIAVIGIRDDFGFRVLILNPKPQTLARVVL